MEKQVMIRCKSIQRDERGKAEEVVLETPGVYGEDEDCRYLSRFHGRGVFSRKRNTVRALWQSRSI